MPTTKQRLDRTLSDLRSNPDICLSAALEGEARLRAHAAHRLLQDGFTDRETIEAAADELSFAVALLQAAERAA